MAAQTLVRLLGWDDFLLSGSGCTWPCPVSMTATPGPALSEDGSL